MIQDIQLYISSHDDNDNNSIYQCIRTLTYYIDNIYYIMYTFKTYYY